MNWNEFIQAVEDRFPPAAPDELSAFEQELGCVLPADYRRFLIECNGGYCGGRLWFNEALSDGRPADVGLHHVYGIRSARSFSVRHTRACYQSEDGIRIPLALLPIADDPFGNAICIGIHGHHRGTIYFWDHELEPDPAAWDGHVETAGNIQQLTSSFSQFVAGLRAEPAPESSPDPAKRMRDDWQRLCDRLKLTGDVAAAWEQLHAHYSEPWRTYHNLLHVDDCLNTCGLCYDLVSDRRAMEAAIWFHDAIYVVGAETNEEQSAELARACLSSLGGSRELIDHVAMLILATDHRCKPQGIEAQLVCDIDLRVLGRGIDVYDRYAAAIQAEVGLPEREYAPHRQVFLEGMLAKQRIFRTEHFGRQYETEARINMQRELEQWAARFGK